MTARIIYETLNQYQKARIMFVQAVSEITLQPQNFEIFNDSGILDILCPLLCDVFPSVQQLTAIALARLTNQNYTIAYVISKKKILLQLLENIQRQSEFFKKAVLFLLRTLTIHSVQITLTIISEGGLEAISLCLQDLYTGVREAAAWTVGYIARHNECLALAVVETGAVPLLVLYLQSSEFRLIQSGASALYDIGKHTSELAQAVVDAGAVPLLVKTIWKQNAKLNRQVLLTLSCIVKHSVQLSKCVVQSQLFSELFLFDKPIDNLVIKAAATLVKEISKHSAELVECVITEGCIKFLIQVINSASISTNSSAILALGYIAGYSDRIAMTIIEMKGVHSLAKMLENYNDIDTFAVSIWTIGQIGKHSFEHANCVAETNVLTKVLMLYNDRLSSKELKTKCKTTLKIVLQKCIRIEVLEPLLHDCPSKILKYILNQFTKILTTDSTARRFFVTTGGLKKVQDIEVLSGSSISRLIKIINCCFPEEIIRYYSPGYPGSLLEAVDHYQPNC